MVSVVSQFDLTFADDREQELLAKLFHKRLNLVNPLHCDLNFDVNIDKCPGEDDNDWIGLLLSDLERWRDMFSILIPRLKPEQWRSLLFWILSPYRYGICSDCK